MGGSIAANCLLKSSFTYDDAGSEITWIKKHCRMALQKLMLLGNCGRRGRVCGGSSWGR